VGRAGSERRLGLPHADAVRTSERAGRPGVFHRRGSGRLRGRTARRVRRAWRPGAGGYRWQLQPVLVRPRQQGQRDQPDVAGRRSAGWARAALDARGW